MNTHSQLVKTARLTGIWYLLMALAGLFGFLIFHEQVFDLENPQNTLNNIIENSSLAYIRLQMEFAIVVTQALTAVWFYRLFKDINNWAAWATGIWGTVNAVAIMVSAIAIGSVIQLAGSETMDVESKLVIIELLTSIVSNAWGVGSLFFGLWLIPLGYCVTSSGRMPLWLGRTLMIGGVGYLLNVVLNYSGLESDLIEALVMCLPPSVSSG